MTPRWVTPLLLTCVFLLPSQSHADLAKSRIGAAKMNRDNTDPSRETMLREFSDPPAEYRPVDCWWWEAGRLSREQMRWQLEELKSKGVGGTWYYPRLVYGQPLSCIPHYWTDEWWEFTKFAMTEHRRLGMRAWFSDWTAHRFFQNKVLEETEDDPSLGGHRLQIHEAESTGKGIVQIEIPEGEKVLTAAAYRKVGDSLDSSSKKDLTDAVQNNKLTWSAPEAGWLLATVTSAPWDLDYLNRRVAERWIDFQLSEYKERLGDLLGDTLEAYGVDEMFVLVGNIIYSPALKARFETRKGYDPTDELAGLFHDVGPRTDKIRCDYYEIMNDLLEESWYAPIPEWLKQNGMLFTNFCPIGKSNSITEQTYHYGDYFRRMRHFDIPGAEEQSGRPHNFTFFAKMASSIAHLYGHKRVGVCAYWGSGWGHTMAENLAWTHENYSYGINFYDRHGGLYTTLGGWYEWVPPAVHFRQPYWQYWKHFTDYITRLSYIMSQGVHEPDVAILYPLTTVHANWSCGGNFDDPAREAALATVNLAESIFEAGIDFDYLDEPSLEQAEIKDGLLEADALEFRTLVMPALTTIRRDSLSKIKAFYDRGGMVVAYGRLPAASPENGRNDPRIRAMIQDIFGIAETPASEDILKNVNEHGGRAFFVHDRTMRVPETIASAIALDVETEEADLYHTHQKISDLDIYYFHNHRDEARRISVSLRASGEPEIWDPGTGEVNPVHRFDVQGNRTRVTLDMEPYDGIVLALTPVTGRPCVSSDNLAALTSVTPADKGIETLGVSDGGGQKEVRLKHEGREYAATTLVEDPPKPIRLPDQWDCHLEPTMNNRWGDFRYPASEGLIGAEARQFRYAEGGLNNGTTLGWHEPSFDDSDWQKVTYSYGPYFWTIGPFEERHVSKSMIDRARQGHIDFDKAYGHPFITRRWERYSFSQKFGAPDKEAHSGWAGLMGVSENFLILRKAESDGDVVRCFFTYVYSPEEREYLFDFGGNAEFPRTAWVNGEQVISFPEEQETKATVRLPQGYSSVLLKTVQPKGEMIETYAVFLDSSEPPFNDPRIPRLRWFVRPDALTYDIRSEAKNPVGWYRFEAPPGLKGMRVNLDARAAQIWVNGRQVWQRDLLEAGSDGSVVTLDKALPETSQVVFRVEQKPGVYGGAVFPEPVQFDTTKGRIPLGDWCEHGLTTYSGCIVYTAMTDLDQKHLASRAILDLGSVRTVADVRINDKPAAILMAPPYRCDISELVRSGANTIEIRVANTLANHMSTYPTKFVYEGQTRSGLLGPVELRFHTNVSIKAVPIRR
ncbi:MAG: glycosyl hydrolase [bacterium]